jgi:hypothetical protein
MEASDHPRMQAASLKIAFPHGLGGKRSVLFWISIADIRLKAGSGRKQPVCFGASNGD